MSEEIQLQFPEEIVHDYAGSLSQLKAGNNTLVGYKDQMRGLRVALADPETPNVKLLGEQGIGKTALVEQLLYDEQQTSDAPLQIITLAIETLGQLDTNLMVARMRTLLGDLPKIVEATQKKYPDRKFKTALFIDEVHKLHGYGLSGDSSGAMNALKEGSARGQFPIIIATTDYEYRKNIATDPAFDRRFHSVIMQQPSHNDVIKILDRRLKSYQDTGKFTQNVDSYFLENLVRLTDGFVRNTPNPAKSLSILSSAVGYAQLFKVDLTDKVLEEVFKFEGYNVRSTVSADYVRDVLKSRIHGQPLAVKYISDAVNLSFYTERDLKRPMMTIFSVGTTGTGKSETAKALAFALFGREDAIVTLNGGDYSTENDALKAQHFIGDSVSVNKQQVVLLDEIEKAHNNVRMGFMRMIDEGIVRDSLGIERSINNTVIIATSNLGAELFTDMTKPLGINTRSNPDELTPEFVSRWQTKENDVRKALQSGDYKKNNGIRPEFLERFSLLIPYLALSDLTYAQIARAQLVAFQRSQLRIGYQITLPDRKTMKEWQKLFGTESIYYDDLDSVSVMIATDGISNDAKTIGARAIARYIKTRVKPAVANEIARRDAQGLPSGREDGFFNITTNGKASFESNAKSGSGVAVSFITLEEFRIMQLRKRKTTE